MEKELEIKYGYGINLGVINYLYREVIMNGYTNQEPLAMAILKTTLQCMLEDKSSGKSLETFLNEKAYLSLPDTDSPEERQEQLNGFLLSKGFLPVVLEGRIYPLFPMNCVLAVKNPNFPFYFALRLSSFPLTELDPFLEYHYSENFQYEKAKYFRFLQLCMREYKEELVQEETIQTVQEWVEFKRMESTPVEKSQKVFPLGTKIVCKADAETIQKYFYQLVKFKVLSSEEVDHLLFYTFATFEKNVPAKKFTPENIGKGELMKFIQHFYTLYAFAKAEAGNWIKLLLVDSTNVLDSPGKTEEEIIQYIKDNWSKEPSQYKFRRP